MTKFVHSLLYESAQRFPHSPALGYKDKLQKYQQLAVNVRVAARQLAELGLSRADRVGIYLPKQSETVTSIFATSAAGGVFVPVNPLLKGSQVGYILKDCNVSILITHSHRLTTIEENLMTCPDLHTVIETDGTEPRQIGGRIKVLPWSNSLGCHELAADDDKNIAGPVTDQDLAAILYTSGSTGNPKGVVLSHRNMVVGAESVSEYLGNTSDDRILAVLPFSFDYGLSQVTTAFNVGASVYLLDYLLPNDIVRAVKNWNITGLAAVPPLWAQLTKTEWPESSADSVRYFTNSGGAMPEATLQQLQHIFSKASPFLMYGLTEAFRSTYLPPSEVKNRPASMGKAIPNAEVMIVRPDGIECKPGEPGELVHSGPLVSLGYWNAPDKTAARFKPAPGIPEEISTPILSVWSGDTAYRDAEGYLYFVGRSDDMIKTSGYRVSPTEVEECVYAADSVVEAAAVGIDHPDLGQAIIVVATPKAGQSVDDFEKDLLKTCQQKLPNFMVPKAVFTREAMPHNANGKIDRKQLVSEYGQLFTTSK